MQTFIQSMLPKNAKHVFGKGLAGDIWRSMLAEKLANEMARSGQVGLAKRLQAGSAAGRVAEMQPGRRGDCAARIAGKRPALPAAARVGCRFDAL